MPVLRRGGQRAGIVLVVAELGTPVVNARYSNKFFDVARQLYLFFGLLEAQLVTNLVLLQVLREHFRVKHQRLRLLLD